MSKININIESILMCPNCSGGLNFNDLKEELVCQHCEQKVTLVNQKPLFTPVSETIQVTEFRLRGEGKGTPWRQVNWDFLKTQIESLPIDALVLDVGAGRGDFSQLVQQRKSLALDIYPYDEVDIICDLTQINPFKEGTFDAVILMNVMEHVFDTQTFLTQLGKILKPGGKLLVAIPFLLKEHQGPYDFVRYTQFSLKQWGDLCNLKVEFLEGYYDPMFVVDQGTNNLKHTVIPEMPRVRNYLARFLLFAVDLIFWFISKLVGKGYCKKPENEKSPAPIGYHVVYRKPV